MKRQKRWKIAPSGMSTSPFCLPLYSKFFPRSRKDALDAVKGGKGGRGEKDRNTSKVILNVANKTPIQNYILGKKTWQQGVSDRVCPI